MTSDTYSGRTIAAEIDRLVDEIRHVILNASSDYTVSRRLLVNVDLSRPKNARRLLRKALRECKAESRIASEYNSIRERMRFSDDPRLANMDDSYRRAMSLGKYALAGKIVQRLASLTISCAHAVVVSPRVDERGYTISIQNVSDRAVNILLVRGKCGGNDVFFDVPSFALQPFCSREVSCCGMMDDSPLHLVVEYCDCKQERSITRTLSFD